MRSYRKIRLFALLPLLVFAAFFVLGCGKGSSGYSTNPNNNPPPPPGSPGSHNVTIGNFAFSPSSLTIAVGDTVTWTNNDNVGHTVTSTSGYELSSSVLAQGQNYQHVFRVAGSYPYHCSIHTYMTGSVTVQ